MEDPICQEEQNDNAEFVILGWKSRIKTHKTNVQSCPSKIVKDFDITYR